MDGVTDAAFRYITAKYGKPDIVITEFTAAEGIRAGATRLLDDFLYSEYERPVVAQLFGADPDAFFVAAAVASALGFDGIDVNMGCPAKNITDRGAGAALIADPERAAEIIRQVKAGNNAWAEGASLESLGVPDSLIRQMVIKGDRKVLPISVKTRLGVSEVTITEWVQSLLDMDLAAITVHGRTLKQLYTGSADWEAIATAAAIVRTTDTLILGNGDVHSVSDAHQRCATYGTHGALIGRAAFGNPWIFKGYDASLKEKCEVALEHAEVFHALFDGKGFVRMRKHLLDYVRGFDGAKELRMLLMKVSTIEEVREILAPVVAS